MRYRWPVAISDHIFKQHYDVFVSRIIAIKADPGQPVFLKNVVDRQNYHTHVYQTNLTST